MSSGKKSVTFSDAGSFLRVSDGAGQLKKKKTRKRSSWAGETWKEADETRKGGAAGQVKRGRRPLNSSPVLARK